MSELIIAVVGGILALLGIGYFKKSKNDSKIKEEKQTQETIREQVEEFEEKAEDLKEDLAKIDQQEQTSEELVSDLNNIKL